MHSDNPWVEFAHVPLPDELIEKINRYLDIQDRVAFSRACKGVNRLKLFKSSVDRATIQAQALKYFVLSGMKEDACKLIEALPHLFFIETVAVYDLARDHRGNRRQVPGSAFQAALAMGYTNLLDLKAVQEVIKANPRTVKAQVEKQFPEGFDYTIKNEAAIDRAFANFVSAFDRDEFQGGYGKASTATVAATTIFRDALALGTLNTLNQGWLFDLRIPIKAIDVLEANQYKWNYMQCDWFSCQIYGYLQTLVSAFDAQVIREGIANVMKDDKISVVPSSLTLKDGNFCYPARPNQAGGVGVDSFVGAYGEGRWVLLRGLQWRRGVRLLLTSYIKQKQQSLVDLTSDNTNLPVHAR